MVRSPRLLRLTVALLGACGSLRAADSPGPTSFRNDVMPVLSKAGCNLGTCHGNANGKGGFKLSLRGDDPDADFHTLTRDSSGRRVNASDPDACLLLQKPTMQLAHEGGRRFSTDSPEYRTLRNWIAAGLPADRPETPHLIRLDVSPRAQIVTQPDDRVQLAVTARFSDGSSRNVTPLACFELSAPIAEVSHEGLVVAQRLGEVTVSVRFLNRQAPVRLAFIPARPDFAWHAPEPRNEIDRLVFAKLQSLHINPSPLCDDATFLRRATLDLLGLLPTADEARQFAADAHLDKRRALVDRLLDRPEFPEFWALKWADLLRNEEKTLDRKGVANFHAWIRFRISEGTPLNEFAREIIAARGSTYANPATNFYRALRDPVSRAEAAAQVFLGVRMQCAKCHNHPFDRWTQDDYYGWTNLFARVDYKVLENNRRDDNDKHEFDGEQIVFMKSTGDVESPQRKTALPPHFLGHDGGPVPPDDDRLLALADWVADPANPFFARVQVNRIWFHLFGRGIVDPLDDFRVTNPPANPELLDWLTRDFVDHGYDLRHTLRTIMDSAVYQLSSEPNDTNHGDDLNFSHAAVRRLTAEQLLDAISRVTDVPAEFSGYPLGLRATQLPGVRAVRSRERRDTLADNFMVRFGKPPRLQSCECERSDEPTLAQTFELISGRLTETLLATTGNRLDRLLEQNLPDDRLAEDLFWTALSRAPTGEELSAAVAHLQGTTNRRAAAEDLLWSLINSAEFLLRR